MECKYDAESQLFIASDLCKKYLGPSDVAEQHAITLHKTQKEDARLSDTLCCNLQGVLPFAPAVSPSNHLRLHPATY